MSATVFTSKGLPAHIADAEPADREVVRFVACQA
jgi:hypothetical protein